MVKHLLSACALSLSLALPAMGQTPPSLTVRIENAETPFEQGALQALIAVERLMQSNYDYGIGQSLTPGTMFILGPRASAMPNPAPKPLAADTFANMIETFAADLDAARTTLAQTPSGNTSAFTVDLSTLWFDVNGNDQFDAAENALPWLTSLAPHANGAGNQPEGPIEVRFDAADHAWLMAYTHALSASAEAILAFDPTPIFADLLAAEARLTDLPEVPYSFDVEALQTRIKGLEAERERVIAKREETQQARRTIQTRIRELESAVQAPGDGNAAADADAELQDLRDELAGLDLHPLRREEFDLGRQIDAARAKLPPAEWDEATRLAQQGASAQRAQLRQPINAIYALLTTLRQQPDPVHLVRLEDHLHDMLTHNRRFWDLVAQETDNDREWVPNGTQTSALGFQIPDQMARDWQAVLADMEAVLEGRLLIPHPLLPQDTGINLAAWFDDPSSLDPIAWLHGVGATPYLARGPRITEESWAAFQRTTGGNGFGFALFLN